MKKLEKAPRVSPMERKITGKTMSYNDKVKALEFLKKYNPNDYEGTISRLEFEGRKILENKEKCPPLLKIYRLCKKIVREDTNFSNLNSEREYAKKTAIGIGTMVDEIKELLKDIDKEDAIMAYEFVKSLDYPFMRVLGDQLDYSGVTKKMQDLYTNQNEIHAVPGFLEKVHEAQAMLGLRELPVEMPSKENIERELEYQPAYRNADMRTQMQMERETMPMLNAQKLYRTTRGY